MKSAISNQKFEYNFLSQFPGDTSYDTSSRPTPGQFYSLVKPTATNGPKLLAFSADFANDFDFSLTPTEDDINLLSGNSVLNNMTPYAIRYGGHQFGHWAGQLGDGRAINLGELFNLKKERWDFQLKGAGPTAYSRRADGRAVLRSSVREYLMSEAMHHLGVPTTRALSLTLTGDSVVRDMFYDGNQKPEPGAVVCRVAPSFLRFGNFEILAQFKEYDNLKKLTTYAIDTYFPSIDSTSPTALHELLDAVIESTLDMIVGWMRVGFTHGVMNTDNMSILGLSIDYGPYSMIDNYDANFTPNTTDLPGRRYAFGKQPAIACWNLERFAEALEPLLNEEDDFSEILSHLGNRFNEKYIAMMERKIGITQSGSKENISLMQSALRLLQKGSFDYTLFFQKLISLRQVSFTEFNLSADIFAGLYKSDTPEEIQSDLTIFLGQYKKHLGSSLWNDAPLIDLMQQSNPAFILRNYQLHMAIEKLEKGDDSLFRELEQLLKNPYNIPTNKVFTSPVPEWSYETPGCAYLSCSS